MTQFCKYKDVPEGYSGYRGLYAHVKKKHADDVEYVEEVRTLNNEEIKEAFKKSQETKDDIGSETPDASVGIDISHIMKKMEEQRMIIEEAISKLSGDIKPAERPSLKDITSYMDAKFNDMVKTFTNMIGKPIEAKPDQKSGDKQDPLEMFVGKPVNILIKGEDKGRIFMVEAITDRDLICSTRDDKDPESIKVYAFPRTSYAIMYTIVKTGHHTEAKEQV